MKNKMVKNIFVVSVGEFSGKVLGFARDLLIAGLFGVSASLDAFFVALNVPVIFVTILGSALSTAFTPVFFSFKKDASKKEHERFVANTTTCIFIAFSLLALVTYIFAAPIVKLMAPGFSGAQIQLAARIVQIFSVFTVLIGLANFFRALLQCKSLFGWAVLAEASNNGILLVAALLLCPIYGLYGLAYAYIIGIVGQVAISLVQYFKDQKRIKFHFSLTEPGMKKVFRLSIPLYFGLIITNIGTIIDRAMASSLPAGSISALSYADKTRFFPITLVGGVLVTVMFPTLSHLASLNQRQQIISLLDKVTKMFLAVCFFILSMVLLLAIPITEILFERGNFNHEATILTAEALKFYALTIPVVALGLVYIKVYYAYQDTKTPVFIGLVSVSSKIILNYLLIGILAHKGIALATAISDWIWGILLAFFLWKKHRISVMEISKTNVFFIIKLIIINIIVFATCSQLLNMINSNTNNVLTFLFTSLVGGVFSLLGLVISGLYKDLELNLIAKKIRRKPK